MKFSIITVTYNSREYVKDCIESVVSQSYPQIEYIIIDGKSTDGTLEVVSRYSHKICKIISEKDKGHIWAMNKGLELAGGDIIGFLHSDDFYPHNRVIENVAAALKKSTSDSLYGNLAYVKKDNPNRIIRHWKAGTYDFNKIRRGWMPPHPAFFVKREIYEKYGFFDTSFGISADYEIILRFLYKYRISASFIPEILVKMRWGGISNRSAGNILKKIAEDYRVSRMYGLGAFTIAMKTMIKLPQFFMK